MDDEDLALLEATDANKKLVRHVEPILDRSATLESIIIRGHLLAEELLRQIVRDEATDAKALDDARLSFQQVLKVAFAFTILSGKKELKAKLLLLNQMRNVLAHEIEGDLNKHTARFMELSVPGLRALPGWRRFGARRRLAIAITVACTELSRYCEVRELVMKPDTSL